MQDKNLEFNINGNILEVADMDWHISAINRIYVDTSCMGKYGEYAIFIDGGFDIVELYYRTKSWDKVYSEFTKLCKAINQVNPSFNKVPGNPSFIDYSKVDKIKLSKPEKEKLIITFKNKEEALVAPINYECAKDRLKLALEYLKEAQKDNALQK